MKYFDLIFICFIIAAVFSSCTNAADNEFAFGDGTYSGSFIRTAPNEKYEPSQVEISFIKGKFSGTSSVEKYPAICEGVYKIKGSKVEFSNHCYFTCDFDGTLILNRAYNINVKDGKLRLMKQSGDNIDIYELTKKD